MSDSFAYPDYILNYLRDFAEDLKAQMSVNVYNGIWQIIQSIDHDLKELSNKNE